ncbi:MAG: hypothetical protein FP814_00720 [Desulfobacterium sp.]|nr:hypothetical protein [Desulfobacterium sp.]MBU3948864.1 hypothetical protein [Pseudomonadota bacterium]MBU4009792.1 hypothetical protein [Pseudomonadota bacterium]MBU4036272.1 hypothetical protein [Pseudomonadota bacterium]
MKKYKLSKALIPIVNGTWGTPKELERLGIAKEDVIKLRTIMEGIVKENRLIESPELKYFLALSGHFETHYIYDEGKIKKDITPLPVASLCSASPYDRALPPTGLFYEYSDELQNIAKNLIELLYEYDFIERLRKCPHCKKFFIAKDKKRKICYEMECRNGYHREDMKKRRNDDPEKYC